MLTVNLNVRVKAEELERFDQACDHANAGKSEVVRMLIRLAASRGIMYNPKTGDPILKPTR